MAEIETKLVDHVLSSGSYGWIVVIIIAELRELMKSIMFSKRRKEDDELRDLMRCKFSDGDIHDMREAAWRVKQKCGRDE